MFWALRNRKAHRDVLDARELNYESATWTIEAQLRKRGLSMEAIADELFAIEIEVWKRTAAHNEID